jgi:hypothetical protein
MPLPYSFMVTMPTDAVFEEGLEAFCFGPLSALGLRVSLLDFFWDFAMVPSFTGEMPMGRYYTLRAEPPYLILR